MGSTSEQGMTDVQPLVVLCCDDVYITSSLYKSRVCNDQLDMLVISVVDIQIGFTVDPYLNKVMITFICNWAVDDL